MGGRWNTELKIMKRKGCCSVGGSSPRRLEGLEYRAHTMRVVFGRKRRERGGERGKKWWKDSGSDCRKIRKFPYHGSSFLLEVSEIYIP